MTDAREQVVEAARALLRVVDGRDPGLRGYYIDAERFHDLREALAAPAEDGKCQCCGSRHRKTHFNGCEASWHYAHPPAPSPQPGAGACAAVREACARSVEEAAVRITTTDYPCRECEHMQDICECGWIKETFADLAATIRALPLPAPSSPPPTTPEPPHA